MVTDKYLVEQLHPEVDNRAEVKNLSDIARHTWQFVDMVHKEGIATLLVTSDKVLEELIKNKKVKFPMISSLVKEPESSEKYRGTSVIIDPNSINFNSLSQYYSNLQVISTLHKERVVVIMRYNPFLCKETQVPYKFINKYSSVVIRSYREIYK